MGQVNVRERIVEAATRSFHEKGFNGTSVQDITSAAGVPKGSFYNHFQSKEVLGAEIVDRYDAANVLIAVLGEPSHPPLERLRRYFSGIAEVMVAAPGGCMIGNFSAEMSDHSTIVRDRLKATWDRWTGGLELAIRDGQADGSIPSDLEAAVLARVLLDAFEGAILRMRVERSARPFDRFMTVAFEKVLR